MTAVPRSVKAGPCNRIGSSRHVRIAERTYTREDPCQVQWTCPVRESQSCKLGPSLRDWSRSSPSLRRWPTRTPGLRILRGSLCCALGAPMICTDQCPSHHSGEVEWTWSGRSTGITGLELKDHRETAAHHLQGRLRCQDADRCKEMHLYLRIPLAQPYTSVLTRPARRAWQELEPS